MLVALLLVGACRNLVGAFNFIDQSTEKSIFDVSKPPCDDVDGGLFLHFAVGSVLRKEIESIELSYISYMVGVPYKAQNK